MSSEAVSDELGEVRESSLDLFGLRLYAVFLIYGGVASVGGMIQGAFHDSFVLDFRFLGIFIGRGLLMRRSTWRAWAVFLAWCGILGSPLGIVALAYLQPLRFTVFGVETTWPALWYIGFVFLVTQFFVSLWFRRILAKKSIRQTFTGKGLPSDGWWAAVAFVSLLAWGGTALHEEVIDWERDEMTREVRQCLENLEHHEMTIQVVDESTGQFLQPITHSSWSSADAERGPVEEVLPLVTFGVQENENGTLALTYSWIGYEPLSLTFSSEGYAKKDVVLGSDEDGKTVQVKLAKLPEQEEVEQADPAPDEEVLELQP